MNLPHAYHHFLAQCSKKDWKYSADRRYDICSRREPASFASFR